jgi:calcium binding protein 39
VQIFNNLLRRQIGARWPTVEYISGKREVLFAAHAGYENEDIALNTGMILREMLRHEPLCKILLYSEQYVFFFCFPFFLPFAFSYSSLTVVCIS